ncbi:hypothetical protein NK6_3917 [Bradyrhizobium diazoefficiens]|uniref:Uncharacterized protein n=1 Tax=Bradyrhizobium diazoefficiens TaxID=1355477 RepID=A0A0E4BP27_9BRAD|nr:hypothetical protein NK6_3917 [Bradyrhizobium diazoefficiens]
MRLQQSFSTQGAAKPRALVKRLQDSTLTEDTLVDSCP